MNQDIFNPTRVTATVGGKEIIFETGRLANQAHGAVWVQCGGTVVLVTVCSQALEFDKGFFPLTVEYSEKMYAAGRIPGSFFRREIGRPSERETLVSRLIDRPIRPLFPKGLNEDVQVLASVISADQENESDVLALTGASALEAHAKTTFVTIGTGGITGVYYPTGGAIAKIVNAKKDKYDIRATVESTGASVFNINAIMSGDLEFGIAQADRQYQAYNGLSEWEGKPQKDLRAVFALAPEAVTFVAAEDSGIKSLKDAKGKVVNIGNPGSGNRQNAIDVFEAAGINIEKDLKAESIKAADAPRMLQDGRIDGFFYTVGHPNGNIKEATAGKRKTRIVSITDIEPLVKKFPYYSLTNIDMAQYPEATNANEKVTTVGMLATFVTSAKVPDDVVYAITKEVFENLDEFKKLHPALEGLTRETMLEGLTAPIHPGALKYYKEAGLMK